MPTASAQLKRHRDLERQIAQLSTIAVFGTLSETYRACGTSSCRCHGPGPKHGPYLTVSYRSNEGKTTGFSVPKDAENDIRAGIEAWRMLQQCLRELADMNKERVLDKARAQREKSP
jgi:hypothetical protein